MDAAGSSLRISALFVVGLLLGAGVGSILLAAQASAFPECNVSSARVLIENDTNGRGAGVGIGPYRRGILVSDTNPPCARASSVAVVNNAEDTAVEVGWYDQYIHVTPCIDTSQPTFLKTWIINGVFHCALTPPALNTGVYTEFWVHDYNRDGTWTWGYNNNTVGANKDMGTFTTGHVRAEAERKAQGDSNYVDHDGLARMGSGGTWYDWDSPITTIVDSDPDYHPCTYNQGLNGWRFVTRTGPC
jgi:hypothetical protein